MFKVFIFAWKLSYQFFFLKFITPIAQESTAGVRCLGDIMINQTRRHDEYSVDSGV